MTSFRLVSLLVLMYFLLLLYLRLPGPLFSGVSCFVCTERCPWFPLCTNDVRPVLLPLPSPKMTSFGRKFSLSLLSLVVGEVWRFGHGKASELLFFHFPCPNCFRIFNFKLVIYNWKICFKFSSH